MRNPCSSFAFYPMYPILFEFDGFRLYTQTLFMMLAFIAGLLVAVREGKQFGLTRLDITDVVLWGFISAIVGARVLFMLIDWETSTFTLREICTLGTADGGFSLHGGLITGGLVGFLAARQRHLSIWRLADALAPGLAAAMFLMRVGCLLNGCDYGAITTAPWGIFLHDAYRHPVQLYEGVGNLLLLPFVLILNRKPLKPGQTMLLYLCCSSILRIVVDFYRDEYALQGHLLTIPQVLAGGIAIGTGAILIARILKIG